MITADRLELDIPAILEGVTEEPRRLHAEKVLAQAADTLREHESRKPIGDLIVENIRTLERASSALERGESRASGDSGIGTRVGTLFDSVPPKVMISIVFGILTALTAAITGVQVDWSKAIPPIHEEEEVLP